MWPGTHEDVIHAKTLVGISALIYINPATEEREDNHIHPENRYAETMTLRFK